MKNVLVCLYEIVVINDLNRNFNELKSKFGVKLYNLFNSD